MDNRKRHSMPRKTLCLFPLVVLLFFTQARAENSGRAEIYSLNTDSFPTLQVGLDVYDETGNILAGLKAGQISILEDNQPRPLLSLAELQPGVRFVLALNLGPEFARRDEQGVSRYDKIVFALEEWAKQQDNAVQDDLRVITNAENATANLSSRQDFRDFLASLQPPLQQLTPTMDTLAQALATAGEPLPEEGMKRVVLFVSAMPASRQEMTALQALTAQAAALHIRVHVWIVGSAAYFTTSGATALKDLAIQSGGQFATFSGQETLPDVEAYLAPLRRTYRLTYASAITTPGNHTLTVSVSHQNQTYTTAPLAFNLNVQPPRAFLVSPPVQIVRQCPSGKACQSALMMPASQILKIIVEFPDGHPRALMRTILYVDGQITDQNTAAPWDTFSWDLSRYTKTEQHLLQVEAVDSLGLSSVSAAVPVTVIVVQPAGGWVRQHLGWIIGIILFSVGLALIAVLSGVRLRHLALPRRRSRAFPTQTTQLRSSSRAGRPASRSAVRHAPAFLIRVNEAGQPLTATPIPLMGEVTFGSDPVKAEIVLDDASIAPLHARIIQREGKHFYIQDEHSIAGTWVNFERIEQPRLLQQGDLIHFGRYIYRFTLRRQTIRKTPHLFR